MNQYCSEEDLATSPSWMQAPTYVPRSFQTPAQLLHLKHVQFYRLQRECCRAMNELEVMVGSCQIGHYTAIVGLSDVCPSIASDINPLACSLLSALIGNTCKLQNGGRYLLDTLDILEALNTPFVQARGEIIEAGIDADKCEQEGMLFEIQLSSLLRNVSGISQSICKLSQSLVQVHSGNPIPPVAEILQQHLYWIRSDYLNALLRVNSVNDQSEGRSTNAFQLSSSTHIQYICNNSVDPRTVLSWYQRQLIRELILFTVADQTWHVQLQDDLEQLHYPI